MGNQPPRLGYRLRYDATSNHDTTMEHSLRDTFAATAIPGLINSPWVRDATDVRESTATVDDLLPVARLAYLIADAMIATRDESIPEDSPGSR